MRTLVCALLVTLASAAHADAVGEVRTQLQAVRKLEGEVAERQATRARLEREAQGLAAAIDREKAAPAATVDPLDGPRELREKADLLRDSEDKLRREVKRLAQRIDDVERRRHLRERAGAIDEDWFGESNYNRRMARSSSTLNAGGAQGEARGPNADSSQAAPPAAGAGGPTAGGVTGGGAPGPGAGPSFGGAADPSRAGGGDASTVLRNLVDPATLEELRRADGSDDLDRQLRALKRAQGELEGLARDLGKRAKTLSDRAESLRKQK
jgi:hypothetical protein